MADGAGVSIATVSRVMSGKGGVSEPLAERVRRAAAELGYRPSFAAQSLATGATRMVGMVVPNLANPYFYDVIKDVNVAAVADGYQLAVADANEDPRAETELSESFLHKLDGLLLMSPRMDVPALRAIAQATDHLVLLNRVVPEVGIPTIAIDSMSGMLELCGHLHALGHRRAVYLGGPEHSWSNTERLRGIRQAGSFGLDVAEVSAGGTIAAGYDGAEKAWSTRPTAIICHNDLVAFGALTRLQELGVRVPEDVSLTGFDDIPFASYGSPALTTVAGQSGVGAAAWGLMKRLLAGHPQNEISLVPAHVVVRGSSAAPRAELVAAE
ncbi:LacI family DNA-binding transcriptional regulator [Klenkia soli]|uniref:LacI family DNA-binding transcriptional regulator n=1 Tax=Klenkia soli TaxID=1052260 RepID=UPI0010421D65|nr:LacI family DNA-binding transcriptional regulator [Klenkia soli]